MHCDRQRPRHDRCHRSKDQNDSTFKLTRKCFRMSKLFGESPEFYRAFVEKNIDLRFHELSELYIAEKGDVNISEIAEEKNSEKIEKLAFYFNQPKDTYTELVKKHPALNFRELIQVIKKGDGKAEIEPEVEQKKEEEVKVQEAKTEVV